MANNISHSENGNSSHPDYIPIRIAKRKKIVIIPNSGEDVEILDHIEM